jgi:hypothetical protein
MKSHYLKFTFVLFTLAIISSCASTSSKNYACDFIQGTDNNFEVHDGRDKYGDTSKSDKSNLLLDLSIGFISATGQAIKRAFTKEDKSQSKKCV